MEIFFLWIAGFSGIAIFEETKVVAMTAKFRQEYAKIAHILVLYNIYDRDWQIQISYPTFSESKWRCSNVGKNIPKIHIAYLSSPTQKTALFTQRNSHYFIWNWNYCNFSLFLSKFGCHGNALCSLKNSDSIYLSSTTPKPYHTRRIVIISRTELQYMHFWFLV